MTGLVISAHVITNKQLPSLGEASCFSVSVAVQQTRGFVKMSMSTASGVRKCDHCSCGVLKLHWSKETPSEAYSELVQYLSAN